MRTAVDTSVLLDVLGGDPKFGAASREGLRRAYDSGSLVASEVVWAEVRAHFPDDAGFARAMDALAVEFVPAGAEAAALAGQLWRESRRQAVKGRSRDKGEAKRVVADFLVGAHALLQADRLLARDRGYFRRSFRGLSVLDPSAR